MLKEFRDFLMRGNVLDLAVGVIIGLAFGAVVNSLVNDVIMPPIGLALSGIDFSSIVITLRAADPANNVPAVTMNIGLFINVVISFLITALAVFLILKSFTAAKDRASRRKPVEPVVPPPPTTDERILATLERINANLDRIERIGS
jgi:large conductance mechanosensitive channel